MATENEVRLFLQQFFQKAKTFGLYFRDDRGKNMQTLLDLDITPRQRKEIIMQLEVSNYVDGPLEDTLYRKGEMWVFGKEVKHNDVYIKISKGLEECGAFCISFHIAERPLKYKFK